MDSRTALELSKLKMQVEILQTLVLRHDVTIPVLVAKQSPKESKQRTLKLLEETALVAENHFLSDPKYQDLDPSERALYADEFRETVEKMKEYVNSIFTG